MRKSVILSTRIHVFADDPSEGRQGDVPGEQHSSPMRLGGILKGGRLWKASMDMPPPDQVGYQPTTLVIPTYILDILTNSFTMGNSRHSSKLSEQANSFQSKSINLVFI